MSSLFLALLVLVSILGAGLVYGLSRLVLHRRADEQASELSASVIFRLSSLHALILALIFAQEQLNLSRLNQSIVDESTALSDVFYDLERYGAEEASALRTEIVRYTQLVVTEEWLALRDDRLSEEAWTVWGRLYEGVLDLAPVDRRQETLRELMLQDIDQISDYRDERAAAAASEISGLFWVAGVSGFIAVVLLYFMYAPNVVNLVMLGVYSGYVGLILVFIYAMNSPFTFSGLADIQPMASLIEDDFAGFEAPPELRPSRS